MLSVATLIPGTVLSAWTRYAIGAATIFASQTVAPAWALETKTFAVDWFSQASYSTDNDCPGGPNPLWDIQYVENLKAVGYAGKELEELVAGYQGGGEARARAQEALRNRGRINGKPVNAFTYPAAVVDPKLKPIIGKYAYGFNLDGKGADSPDSFQDPETGERGVDNELFRATGCVEQIRSPNQATVSTYWAYTWGSIRMGGNPVWLITITGEDLDKDGPVTISFDRSLDHIVLVGADLAQHDVTYRIDPDPRSHHEFEGRIKDGVISITKPGFLRLLADPMYLPELVLNNTHMRLKVNADGTGSGLLAGYQPWRDYYYGMGLGGQSWESFIIGDQPGIYYSVRKYADADPDPETGANRAISATYGITVVPVFAVKIDEAPVNEARIR